METEKIVGVKGYLLVGMVALVLIVSVFQSFQIKSLKTAGITGNAVQSGGSGGIDMSGWTDDEKMMYEHHGTLPARLGQNSNPSSNMVGGC